jgi:hypothetical protein
MILASGVFGYAMNSIVSLFQNTNESLEEVLNHNDAAIVYKLVYFKLHEIKEN